MWIHLPIIVDGKVRWVAYASAVVQFGDPPSYPPPTSPSLSRRTMHIAMQLAGILRRAAVDWPPIPPRAPHAPPVGQSPPSWQLRNAQQPAFQGHSSDLSVDVPSGSTMSQNMTHFWGSKSCVCFIDKAVRRFYLINFLVITNTAILTFHIWNNKLFWMWQASLSGRWYYAWWWWCWPSVTRAPAGQAQWRRKQVIWSINPIVTPH